MTHIFFDQDKIDWGPYLRRQQVGEGTVMEGRGESSETAARVFRGLRYTNGYGTVRNMLGSIGRFLLPIASNLAETAKKEALQSISNVSNETVAGKPFLNALTEEAKAAGSRLGQKIQQCGKGKRKKRSKSIYSLNPALPIIKAKKKRGGDYLDFN